MSAGALQAHHTGPQRELIIGLDVGTTGVKAVAFAPGSAWRQIALREYPLLEPHPGQAVQDPATVLAAVAQALAEAVKGTGDANVMAVAVSTAMHGLVGLDADRRPLTQLITWADARAAQEALSLQQCGVALHSLTGTPVHPMTPLSKLAWLARHDPRTLVKARWWVGLKELVLAWLTGLVVSELSCASASGLLDMHARAWSPTAVGLAGISAEQLPPIHATTAQLPLCAAAAAHIGLPSGTPVVLGAGDGPLGNLGTGAIIPGVAGLSLGTSGAVRVAVNEPAVDDKGALFCFALTDALWVLGGAISNGGAVARWAERALVPDVQGGGAAADEALLQLAGTVPAGSDGLVMLPYLLAERAPLWSPSLCGAYLGLRHEHTRAHLARAAIEGTCAQVRLIVERLQEVIAVDSVRATGGVFRAPLWRQIMAATLGRPLRVIGEAEGTALGAAALGLLALGRAPSLTAALALLRDREAVEPSPTVPDPALVAAYEHGVDRVAAMISELDRVATLMRGDGRASAGRIESGTAVG